MNHAHKSGAETLNVFFVRVVLMSHIRNNWEIQDDCRKGWMVTELQRHSISSIE